MIRFVPQIALLAGVVAACSSCPPVPPPRQPGTLSAGTAQVTVDDTGTATTHAVTCTKINWLTIIRAGDQSAGITAAVVSRSALTAESVTINNQAGFTGSYLHDLNGRADVTMADTTYTITGVAHGVNADNPRADTTGTFAIKVAC